METKPAIYTTEFWTLIVGTVATVLNLIGVWDFISNWHNGIVWTVIAAAYQISRGQAKSGVAADPRVPANFKLVPRSKDARPRG